MVTCILVALLVVVFAAFVAGLEFGHRRGYDNGWSDCKFDAKQALFPNCGDPFWGWYGSTNSVVIRKRRSFFLNNGKSGVRPLRSPLF